MTQVRTDKSTWQWSDNEVLCRLDYLMDADAGMGIPWEWIEPNIAAIKAAADICDELVLSPNAGGYEKRYRVWGTYTLDTKPANVLATFERHSDGRTWVKADGSIGISVGRFVPPTVTIPAKHIVSYSELKRGRDKLTAVAGIRAQYLEPENNYQETDAEPWPDGDTVMELGEDRVQQLDLTWAPSFGQARRLMKRAFVRATAPWTGSPIITDLYGLKALDERYVAFEFDDIERTISFEINKLTIDLVNNQCQFDVTAIDASIDVFDALTEEGTPAGLPSRTAWMKTLTGVSGDLAGTNSGGVPFGLRLPIAAADETASGSAVRLSFTNLSGTAAHIATLDAVAIVERSGATANGTTTPTLVTFGGAPGITIGIGETVVSDWVDYTFAAAVDHLVAIDSSVASFKNANYGDHVYGGDPSTGAAVMTSVFDLPNWWLLSKIEVK